MHCVSGFYLALSRKSLNPFHDSKNLSSKCSVRGEAECPDSGDSGVWIGRKVNEGLKPCM